MVTIPPDFARNVRGAFRQEGDRWLRDLPTLIADLARQWDLAVGPPFELSYNYVAPARRGDGTDAVLKVGVPDAELAREIMAVRLYAGDGMCRLLEADDARQAMLLERLSPGEMLVGLAATDDAAATRIGADVMRRLWRPVPVLPDGRWFRPIAEWFLAFDRHRVAYGGSGPFPSVVLDRADALARDLLASAPTEVLLHGDLHHSNILSSQPDRWLAIDPKGMTGDPGYEVGPFLLNPWTSRVVDVQFQRRRLDILAGELGYERARLRDWGIAHAVLSACWSAKEGGDWQHAIAVAETLIGA